jgi:dephospho-CoA kinase
MKKVGLTGGMGSGKSVVSHLLEIMGFPVYDSDWHAKQLMQNDQPLRESLVVEFGSSVYKNDSLNRQYLSSLVFDKPDRLNTLNQLVHPAVKTDFLIWADKQCSPMVFLESAILFESTFSVLMDKVVVVTAPLELRIDRIIQRDGDTKEDILKRFNNQWSDQKRASMADYVIINDNNRSIIEQVDKIVDKLTHE